jgi:hypothetical protein
LEQSVGGAFRGFTLNAALKAKPGTTYRQSTFAAAQHFAVQRDPHRNRGGALNPTDFAVYDFAKASPACHTHKKTSSQRKTP